MHFLSIWRICPSTDCRVRAELLSKSHFRITSLTLSPLLDNNELDRLKNSWRQGLKGAVWGNPDSVRDSDVLRYQWPSIGKGWERGLLKFASAQRRYDDHALLQQVLDLPNTTVAIVIGSRDRVISPEITLKFLSDFQDYNLNVVQLQNMGHNSFEEDVETFITTVEKILMVKKE